MKIAKLHRIETRDREVWEAVIRYANASPSDSASTRAQDFETLIKAGFDWISGDLSHGLDDIEMCDDAKDATPLETLADRYRSDFRFMLAWLVAPDMWFHVREQDEFSYQEFAQNAGDFLGHHATGIRMSVITNTEYLPTTAKDLDSRWLANTVLTQCVSVISPVCKFILDQIVRHNKGEELRRVIPIGHCKRPGCERFFFVERVGRARFCSDLCRVKFNGSIKTKEENAERMRKHRARLKERDAANLKAAKVDAIKRTKGRAR